MGEPSPTTGTETVTSTPPATRPVETDLTVTVLDQPRVRPETIPQRPGSTSLQNDPHHPEFNLPGSGGTTTTTTTTTTTPTTTTPPAVTTTAPDPQTPAANTGDKIARIRYTVPPILRPLPLKIEIVDLKGTRVLLERNARASETVRLDSNYSQEAIVSIYLGGDSVWQERFR